MSMTRDLFGFDPVEEPADGEIAVALVLHDQTDRAWLLADDEDRRKARWAPKSQAKRGEGRDANVWTMPVWLARDRGWL